MTTFHGHFASDLPQMFERNHGRLSPPPGCPKSPREAETLRTPIQGQKRILDSH